MPTYLREYRHPGAHFHSKYELPTVNTWQMTEGVSMTLVLSRAISDCLLICTQGEGPALNP